ncbi:MAG: hypothetical protein AAGD10_08305 [Myxococcota bacterium]
MGDQLDTSDYRMLQLPRLQKVYVMVACFFGIALLLDAGRLVGLFSRSRYLGIVALSLGIPAPLCWLGLAWLAENKPRSSVYIGILLFIFLDILPSLVVPAASLVSLLRKGATIVGLSFAWKIATDLEKNQLFQSSFATEGSEGCQKKSLGAEAPRQSSGGRI